MTTQRTQRTRAPHVATVKQRPPSDTQVRYVTLASNTTRQTLVTPTAGKAIRLIRVKYVAQGGASAQNIGEVYFGTGADITTNAKKAIDVISFPNAADTAGRTYNRGQGPKGVINDVLSSRFQSPPGATMSAVIEYTEEP